MKTHTANGEKYNSEDKWQGPLKGGAGERRRAATTKKKLYHQNFLSVRQDWVMAGKRAPCGGQEAALGGHAA